MKHATQTVIPTLNPVYAQRLAKRNQSSHQKVWNVLDQVHDPELPGLTIWDLGVLQNVELEISGSETIWRVEITPTYSGCPAVEVMASDVKSAMQQAGYAPVVVKVVLSPPWSTDMMSPNGKQHLKSISIAPPDNQDKVHCPLCDSAQTKVISQFGSTACKALYQCEDCLEFFDYFKHF